MHRELWRAQGAVEQQQDGVRHAALLGGGVRDDLAVHDERKVVNVRVRGRAVARARGARARPRGEPPHEHLLRVHLAVQLDHVQQRLAAHEQLRGERAGGRGRRRRRGGRGARARRARGRRATHLVLVLLLVELDRKVHAKGVGHLVHAVHVRAQEAADDAVLRRVPPHVVVQDRQQHNGVQVHGVRLPRRVNHDRVHSARGERGEASSRSPEWCAHKRHKTQRRRSESSETTAARLKSNVAERWRVSARRIECEM